MADSECRFKRGRMEMEFPYATTFRLSTKPRRRWKLQWVLTEVEKEIFLAFFDARRGGEGSFTFTLPEGSLATAFLVSESLSMANLSPNAWTVTAEFEEIHP